MSGGTFHRTSPRHVSCPSYITVSLSTPTPQGGPADSRPIPLMTSSRIIKLHTSYKTDSMALKYPFGAVSAPVSPRLRFRQQLCRGHRRSAITREKVRNLHPMTYPVRARGTCPEFLAGLSTYCSSSLQDVEALCVGGDTLWSFMLEDFIIRCAA